MLTNFSPLTNLILFVPFEEDPVFLYIYLYGLIALVPKRLDTETSRGIYKFGAETSRVDSSRYRNDLVPKRL